MREFQRRYAGGDGGRVLRERTQRGILHLEIADISVTLAREVQNLRVGVEERGKVYRRPGWGEVEKTTWSRDSWESGLASARRSHSLYSRWEVRLKPAVTTCGESPNHAILAALRSVVWRPLAHHTVLAGIEDAIHLILRGHAEEAAAVVPVQILRETLEIVRSHLITQIAVPHLASSISMRQIYILIKRRCRHGNQIGHRIELHKGHLSVMAVEGQYGLRDVLLGTSLGELPQLAINPCRNGNHHAQIRRRTDDLLVVEGVEVKIAEIASTESQPAGDSTCDPSEGAAGRASFQECGAHGIRIGPPPPPAGKAKYFELPLM